MKRFKINKQYLTISIYVVASLCAVILFLMMIYNLSTVTEAVKKLLGFLSAMLKPVIWGFFLAYLLNRPVQYLYKLLSKIKSRKLTHGVKKGISISVGFLILFLALFLIFYAAIPAMVQSITQLVEGVPTYTKMVNDFVQKLSQNERLVQVMATFNFDLSNKQSVSDFISSQWATIQGWLERLASSSMNFLVSFSRALVNMFLALFFSIYMLIDKDNLRMHFSSVVKRISPKLYYRAGYVLKLTDEMFFTFLTGKAFCSLIIGVLTFVPCAILQIKYAGLISILVAVSNMIPIFGPLIGSVPAVFLGMLTAPIYGVWVLVIIVIAQQIESNIISPKILGDSVGINAFWVLFSIVVFGKIWGVLGMLFATPIFGVFAVLFKDWLRTPAPLPKIEEEVVEKEQMETKLLRYHEEREQADQEKKEVRMLQKQLNKLNSKRKKK
mgnify:CR=1 FL=1